MLNNSFARRFANLVVHDDSLFEAALVHLGGLGFINTVLLELADYSTFERVTKIQNIDFCLLNDVATSDFDAVATRFGRNSP